MRVCLIMGTRPEIIKLSPLIQELRKRDIENTVLYTGQHYSVELSDVFFDLFGYEPDENLEVGSHPPGVQTGKMMEEFEAYLQQHKKFDFIVVHGDTNSSLAGALVGCKRPGVQLAHVEGGIRSFDLRMQEEINRMLIDRLSDALYTPTEFNKQILRGEGVSSRKVSVVGNTISDSMSQYGELIEDSTVFDEMGVEEGEYLLVTVHRDENVNEKSRMEQLVTSLQTFAEDRGLDVVFPMHVKTKEKIEDYGISTDGIKIEPSQSYINFVALEKRAKMIVTDSGGVQEEACILGVPCVTVRDNTERPETLAIGANMLTSPTPEMFMRQCNQMIGRRNVWQHPYGSNGRVSKRIVDDMGARL